VKAIFLIKQGDANSSFQQRDIPVPVPAAGQVLIKVKAFGLNFADVMARKGLYKEAPPIPCVLGYDVAGTVEQLGEGVNGFAVGDEVVAMTRFGGYAEYAVTEAMAMARIPQGMDAAAATALATQYCTAYYAAAEAANLHAADKVLIQSGAGGVGTALIQLCKHIGCEVFSTAGSDAKLQYLRELGVDHPINYQTQDFEKEVRAVSGKAGVDAVFDAVGGKSVKKGMRLLNAGGKMVCYGASALSNKNLAGKAAAALAFGIYHPLMLMMPSKSIIGVNMLKIADHKPKIIQRCLQHVVQLVEQGVFKPTVGKVFTPSEIGAAHDFLEKRKSTGKVAIQW
jgi:NADPH2:quinone reductase